MKKTLCLFAATFFIVACASCARVGEPGKGIGGYQSSCVMPDDRPPAVVE